VPNSSEFRLGNAIDYKIVPEWIAVSERVPDSTRTVVVAGENGYIRRKRFMCLAYYDAEYRPRSPWQTVQDSSLSDYGWEPTHWRDLLPGELP
jgi:hypothetical protein